MIYIGLNIENPFSNRFDNLYCKEYLYGPHNAIEMQLMKDISFIRFSFRWSVRTDHAGIELEVGLLGYSISINTHDTRHWDYDSDNWEVYSNHDEDGY